MPKGAKPKHLADIAGQRTEEPAVVEGEQTVAVEGREQSAAVEETKRSGFEAAVEAAVGWPKGTVVQQEQEAEQGQGPGRTVKQ